MALWILFNAAPAKLVDEYGAFAVRIRTEHQIKLQFSRHMLLCHTSQNKQFGRQPLLRGQEHSHPAREIDAKRQSRAGGGARNLPVRWPQHARACILASVGGHETKPAEPRSDVLKVKD